MMMPKECCIHYKDYDYMLKLSEKQYEELREMGFNAKKAIRPKNDVPYWIAIHPLQIDPYTGNSLKIPGEFEDRFLYRNDIKIDFHVGETMIRDRIFKRLYFTSVDIKEARA